MLKKNIQTFVKALAEQIKKIITVVDSVHVSKTTGDLSTDQMKSPFDDAIKFLKTAIEIAQSNISPIFLPNDTKEIVKRVVQMMNLMNQLKEITTKPFRTELLESGSKPDKQEAIKIALSFTEHSRSIVETVKSVVKLQRDATITKLFVDTVETIDLLTNIFTLSITCFSAENKIMNRIHIGLNARNLVFPLTILLDPLYHSL